MSDSFGRLTVMGPEGKSSLGSGGSINDAPTFITNVTLKPDYRQSLRIWMKMICSFAEVDTNFKAFRRGAGRLIFFRCDATAKELLKEAEVEGELSLDYDERDTENVQLVESVINAIAMDFPTEIVKRELDLLTTVQNCEGKDGEKVSSFAARFKGAVAKYNNHTSGMHESFTVKFAILMLRNVKLTTDTMNSIIFQLTASNAF